MRLRTSVLPIALSLFFVVGTACFLLSGCGGGGGGSKPNPNPSPVQPSPTPSPSPTGAPSPVPSPTPTPTPQVQARFTVQWAQRSRATSSPSSALSGTLTLVGAQPDGSDAVITINRDTSRRDAYSQTYTFPSSVYVGKWPLQARFCAGADAQGAVVAQAAVPVTIASNGSGISDIVLAGTIARVTFPPQEILYPGLNDLQFIATDDQDNLIAVSPGSVFYRIQSGSDLVRFNSEQYAEGIAPGVASIIATIDGKDSPPGTLRIDAPAVVTVSPNAPVIAPGATLRLSATVANVTDQSVRWRMKYENTGTVDANGVYTAPNREGDFTVVATSVFDPRASVEITVRVRTGTLPVVVE